MPGPTPSPTRDVYDRYTELLLRRAALQQEIQGRPTDRGLRDQLAAVELELGQLQSEIARGGAPGAGPTPTPTAGPTPTPGAGRAGPATPAPGGLGQLTSEQLLQLVAPTLGVQEGRLDLDREKFAYAQWLDAQDRLRQQMQDAWGMFMDRLRLGAGGGTPGLTHGQALPYMVAPGTRYMPGFEVGGPVEMLYNRYGLQFDPEQWRTAEVPLATPAAPVELPSWAP